MKYQITCDHCGTQFIIDAEPGKTVECQCPGCHGVMQITLPNVAKGERYVAPPKPESAQDNPWQADTVDADNRPNLRWVWIAVAVVVVVVAVIGFAMLRTSSPQPDDSAVAPVDTIPYEQPVEEEKPQQQIDTIVEMPAQPEVEEEPQPQEPVAPEPEVVDTTAAME